MCGIHFIFFKTPRVDFTQQCFLTLGWMNFGADEDDNNEGDDDDGNVEHDDDDDEPRELAPADQDMSNGNGDSTPPAKVGRRGRTGGWQ